MLFVMIAGYDQRPLRIGAPRTCQNTHQVIIAGWPRYAPLPANSSQLAAVVASGQGYDFVLDGPLGAGKSQTIANIISQDLALGRRVLFSRLRSRRAGVTYERLAILVEQRPSRVWPRGPRKDSSIHPDGLSSDEPRQFAFKH